MNSTDLHTENPNIIKETIISSKEDSEIISKDIDGNPSDIKKSVKEISKVLLFLRPVGEASGLKKTRYKLDGSKSIIEVENFLKKTLGMSLNQNLFLYCGSGFSPTPDQNLQDLFDNFQTGGELIVNYGIQEVWG
jgi:ubiquitin-like protein ATG12